MNNQTDGERAAIEAQRRFHFEVASATHRLFCLLNALELLRAEVCSGQVPHSPPVMQPPSLDVLVSVEVAAEGEDPLSRYGSVEQSAYLAWVAEVVSANDRSRSDLKAIHQRVAPDAILPETPVLGDLNKIRNDLLHNNRVASRNHTGKCEVLKWFKVGDRIDLETRHVFEFLNQLGIYGASLFRESEDAIMLVRFSWMLPEALARQPVPRLISVRPVDAEHRETGQNHQGLSLFYDNGVHVLCDLGERAPVDHVEIRAEGAVVAMPDLDEIDAVALYQQGLLQRLMGPSKPSHLRGPWGPWSRIRRDQT